MKKFENIEDLDLDFGELEEIERGLSGMKVLFPAITLGKQQCYFNNAALQYVPDLVRWFVNDEWVVLREARQCDKNVYKVRKGKGRRGSRDAGALLRLPSNLESAPLSIGTHKLFKTKGGLCFKRYEVIRGDE